MRTNESITDCKRTILPDGSTLLIQERDTPVIGITVFFTAGSLADPHGQEGLARLTAKLLSSQTGKKDIYEFDEYIETYGIKVNGTVRPDFVEFSYRGLTRYRDRLLAILEETLRRPSFEKTAFEHLRRLQLSKITQRTDDSFRYAFDMALKEFYGDHPYNHPTVGFSDTVESLNADMARDFYNTHFDKSDMVVSVVGPISSESIETCIGQVDFPDEENTENDEYTTRSGMRRTFSRSVGQPTHVLFYAAPPISSEKFIPTNVLNALLGGGMASLLFTELREKRSLGYQVGSSYPTRRLSSTFRVYLGGGSSSGEEFRSAFDELARGLCDRGPSGDAVKQAKEYLKGRFTLNHETPGKMAWYRGFYEIMGRSSSFDTRYPDLIDQVKTSDVQETARMIFKRTDPVFVTVHPDSDDSNHEPE